VEGVLSLDLRKEEKKEEERVWVLAVVRDGRRVDEDWERKESVAIERGRSEETNSRASGEDCRKCWS
jgi:hypothetical protein